MKKNYKEPSKEEVETTINILYNDNILSIYTNKAKLQRKLLRILGEPQKEDTIGKSIVSSRWDVALDDTSKINKIILKAKIYSN